MPKSKAPPIPSYPVLQMDRLEQWADLDRTRSYIVRRSHAVTTRWYSVDLFDGGFMVSSAAGPTLELAAGNALKKAG